MQAVTAGKGETNNLGVLILCYLSSPGSSGTCCEDQARLELTETHLFSLLSIGSTGLSCGLGQCWTHRVVCVHTHPLGLSDTSMLQLRRRKLSDVQHDLGHPSVPSWGFATFLLRQWPPSCLSRLGQSYPMLLSQQSGFF